MAGYGYARDFYAERGIDSDMAIEAASAVPLSIHCWQGDDVAGFAEGEGPPGGGIQVTGSYPGKARTPEQLRDDLDAVFSLVPGAKRLNLHAIYAETGGKKVSRDELEVSHFSSWIEWARRRACALDFNPTLFSHPLASDGLTLTHPDGSVREFWIRHCVASRRIGEGFGKALGSPCVTNLWIPDGYKDGPADRTAPRKRLLESLDRIFADRIDPNLNLDAVESKVFGIGSESYVAGSHEFYLSYALSRGVMVTLDAGHFHPTESIADKISSILLFADRLLLHVSRPVRWDSDHVVAMDDSLMAIARETVAPGMGGRILVGLDFFDASVNRIAAWTIGARNARRALLNALLEPREEMAEAEGRGDYTRRLFLQEECKAWPAPEVWRELCLREGAPEGEAWYRAVKGRERKDP